MSQESSTLNNLGKDASVAQQAPGVGGQPPFPLLGEGNPSTHTPGRYWRLFNDPGLIPPMTNPRHYAVTLEAFLGLTYQVQAFARMIQIIISYIPQLMQPPMPQQRTNPVVPQEESPSEGRPSISQRPDGEVPRLPLDQPPEHLSRPLENVAEQQTPTASTSLSSILNPDTLSSDSTNLLRVHVPDDPMRTTRIWYTRLKSSSIFCFNQLAKEFELNFLVSARLRLSPPSWG
ncbi:hypothetical protein BHM03_00043154 [Ensete ventricosum]|nr:hypothetical protein BHM03_00043154 [Ensete ventricosum]